MKILIPSAFIGVITIAAAASHAQENPAQTASPDQTQLSYRWVAASPGNIPGNVVPYGGTNNSNTPGEVASVETFVARAIDSSREKKWLAACDGIIARTLQTNDRSQIASLVEYGRFEALVPAEGFSLVWAPAGRKITDQSLAQMNALKLDVGIFDRSRGRGCRGYLIRFNDGAGNVVPAFYGNTEGTQVPNRTSLLDTRRGGIGTLEVLTARRAGDVLPPAPPMEQAAKKSIVDLAMGLPGDGPMSFRLRTPADGTLFTVGVSGDEASVGVAKQMKLGVNPNGRQVWLLNKAAEGKFYLRDSSVGKYLSVPNNTGFARVTSLNEGDAAQVFEIEVIAEADARSVISRRAVAHYENAAPGTIGFVRIRESNSGHHLSIEKDPKVILSGREFDLAQLFMMELLDNKRNSP